MVYLTEETFVFVINGYDRDYNLSTPDVGKEAQKSIRMDSDFAINMGSRLDSSVEYYYCEMIQYTYNAYKFGIVFSQLYGNLAEEGEVKLLTEKATYPLTQPTSTHYNTVNDNERNGFTRQSVNKKQTNSFVCKNFNSQNRWFRMGAVSIGEGYGIIDGYGFHSHFASRSAWNSYGGSTNTTHIHPYSSALGNQDGAPGTYIGSNDNYQWLKSYPIAMMYMTPIYKEKIPRLLKEDEAITLIISSQERTTGVYGHDCIIPIDPINSKYSKFKAVFTSLHVMGGLNISEDAVNKFCNFSFNFVCYNWDKSNYGYGGDKDNNGTILTSLPITYNYQTSSSRTAKLSSYNGAIIDIENIHKEVGFKFMMSQMVVPSTENFGVTTPNGFLHSINPQWEFMLTMKLYGIE